MRKNLLFVVLTILAVTVALFAVSYLLEIGDMNFDDGAAQNNPPQNVPEKNINIYSVEKNWPQIIVFGEARVFENALSVRIRGGESQKIYSEKNIMANSPDVGLFGDFTATFDINEMTDKAGDLESKYIIEAFDYSAKDGSEINKVTENLVIDKNLFNKINVYFGNNKLDPQISCNQTFPAPRLILKTITPARESILELIKGTNSKEAAEGFFSSLPENVSLNKITITNGIARADFDDNLEKGVGGSCRISAIRSQIENTLKQFGSVSQVIISINNRTEDILQP